CAETDITGITDITDMTDIAAMDRSNTSATALLTENRCSCNNVGYGRRIAADFGLLHVRCANPRGARCTERRFGSYESSRSLWYGSDNVASVVGTIQG